MEMARTVLACLMLTGAVAASAADHGFYFGVLGGRADYEFRQPDVFPVNAFFPGPPLIGITPVIRPPGITPAPCPPGSIAGGVAVAFISPLSWPPDADHEAGAWGVVAGYRIFRYAAFELSYLDLGSLDRTQEVRLGFPPVGSIEIHHELATSGPAASALGILPITESWEVYARAGVLFADMEATSSIMGSSNSITFGSDSLLWGGGTQFNWGAHWSVRLDFQRFEGVGEDNGPGEADVDLLSLGVLYRL
jgi:opacity protein-like surface antigen